MLGAERGGETKRSHEILSVIFKGIHVYLFLSLSLSLSHSFDCVRIEGADVVIKWNLFVTNLKKKVWRVTRNMKLIFEQQISRHEQKCI